MLAANANANGYKQFDSPAVRCALHTHSDVTFEARRRSMCRAKRGVPDETSIRGLYRFRKNHVTDDKRGLGFSVHVTDSF